jgi:hypothetical protein
MSHHFPVMQKDFMAVIVPEAKELQIWHLAQRKCVGRFNQHKATAFSFSK